MLGRGMDDRQVSIGLLVLRLGGAGLLISGNALSLMGAFHGGQIVFPDPVGIGAGPSWASTIFAELFCPIFVLLGMLTRIAALPPLVVMAVSALQLPAGTSWPAREAFLLLALPFCVLTFTGAGDYSFDARIVSDSLHR
jgi:putative oxidoreductase